MAVIPPFGYREDTCAGSESNGNGIEIGGLLNRRLAIKYPSYNGASALTNTYHTTREASAEV